MSLSIEWIWERIWERVWERVWLGVCVVLGVGVCSLVGCNVVAPIAYAIEGPPTVEARMELDGSRSTVIFVDDRGYGDQMIVPRRSLRREIGRVAEELLLAEGVVKEGNMIRSSDALRAVTSESSDEPMSVVEVGRAVGAEVVIYLEVTAFSVTRTGSTVSPTASGRVVVYDAGLNERIGPESGWLPLEVRLPPGDRQLAELDREAFRAVEDGLAGSMGLSLARMFFERERPAPSPRF